MRKYLLDALTAVVLLGVMWIIDFAGNPLLLVVGGVAVAFHWIPEAMALFFMGLATRHLGWFPFAGVVAVYLVTLGSSGLLYFLAGGTWAAVSTLGVASLMAAPLFVAWIPRK